MQIWRMRPDGSEQEALTADEFNNWFAHPSPDGRTLVFLSFEKDVDGHPANKDVTLRRMTLADGRSTSWPGSSAARGRSTSPAGPPTAARSRS